MAYLEEEEEKKEEDESSSSDDEEDGLEKVWFYPENGSPYIAVLNTISRAYDYRTITNINSEYEIIMFRLYQQQLSENINTRNRSDGLKGLKGSFALLRFNPNDNCNTLDPLVLHPLPRIVDVKTDYSQFN